MIDYIILQLPMSDPSKFMSLGWVEKRFGVPDKEDYVQVYAGKEIDYRDTETILDAIWEKLNINHPADYHAHSLSVSDVVGLNVSSRYWEFYYVDSIGFKRIWRV